MDVVISLKCMAVLQRHHGEGILLHATPGPEICLFIDIGHCCKGPDMKTDPFS